MREKHMEEKKHRLPRYCYRGEVAVAFTACVAGGRGLFLDEAAVQASVAALEQAAEHNECTVPVYCFMPEHVHLILQGTCATSDTWQAMVEFKQRSGFWLKRNRPGIRWQKDFYDHVIRRDEDLGAQVRYVANNPVRRGLAENWDEYAHSGAIGLDLRDVMEGAVTL
jgi:putative transposase